MNNLFINSIKLEIDDTYSRKSDGRVFTVVSIDSDNDAIVLKSKPDSPLVGAIFIQVTSDQLRHDFDYFVKPNPFGLTGIYTFDEPECLKIEDQCDCGSFKTFNSMDPSYHSHWCKSVKKTT